SIPIFISGLLYVAHGFIADYTSLLVLRAINGFALAFLMPAAFALISGYAKNSRQQGKNMAIVGILGVIADIIAPILGGKLGTTIGYANKYSIMGYALLVIAVYNATYLGHIELLTVKQKK